MPRLRLVESRANELRCHERYGKRQRAGTERGEQDAACGVREGGRDGADRDLAVSQLESKARERERSWNAKERPQCDDGDGERGTLLAGDAFDRYRKKREKQRRQPAGHQEQPPRRGIEPGGAIPRIQQDVSHHHRREGQQERRDRVRDSVDAEVLLREQPREDNRRSKRDHLAADRLRGCPTSAAEGRRAVTRRVR